MLIRRTLKFSILLVSMACWSWWLIKSFAAPGWSSFETCPDPAGTIYFYFRRKKKLQANFFALVQEDYKSLLRRRTLQTFCYEDFYSMRHQGRRRCTSHTSDPPAGPKFAGPCIVLVHQKTKTPNSTNYDPNYVSMTEVQNYRGHPLDDCQYKTYGRLE